MLLARRLSAQAKLFDFLTITRMLRLLYASVLVCLSFATAAYAQATTRPSNPVNILWLTFEDSSPWLACYGDKTAPTPNIDRLAREGIRYTHAYATTPVCAPARHTLITGMYATETGAMHMRNEIGRAHV